MWRTSVEEVWRFDWCPTPYAFRQTILAGIDIGVALNTIALAGLCSVFQVTHLLVASIVTRYASPPASIFGLVLRCGVVDTENVVQG